MSNGIAIIGSCSRPTSPPTALSTSSAVKSWLGSAIGVAVAIAPWTCAPEALISAICALTLRSDGLKCWRETTATGPLSVAEHGLDVAVGILTGRVGRRDERDLSPAPIGEERLARGEGVERRGAARKDEAAGYWVDPRRDAVHHRAVAQQRSDRAAQRDGRRADEERRMLGENRVCATKSIPTRERIMRFPFLRKSALTIAHARWVRDSSFPATRTPCRNSRTLRLSDHGTSKVLAFLIGDSDRRCRVRSTPSMGAPRAPRFRGARESSPCRRCAA